jgi:hypothetical protein
VPLPVVRAILWAVVSLAACHSEKAGQAFLDEYQTRACAKFMECGYSRAQCDDWLDRTNMSDEDQCWTDGKYNANRVDECWETVDLLTCSTVEYLYMEAAPVTYCGSALASCMPDSGG